MTPKPTVLFLAYGIPDLSYQAIFSVLNLYHHLQEKADHITCVIYTDDPTIFQRYLADFPVVYETLTPAKIQEYRGPLNFALRVKVCVIRDCLRKYQGKLLFLDADTFCLRSPLPLIQEISPTTTFLQVEEYDMLDGGLFEDRNWLQIRRIVKETEFALENKTFKIPMTCRMWNSGIIGLDPGHGPLADRVLQLTDQIYAASPVFTAEQFAFSYILQTETTVRPTGDYILHYWQNALPAKLKTTYTHHLRKFFKRNGALGGPALATEAFRLAQRRQELTLPPKSLLERLLFRLKIVTEVAVKGRIDSPDY